MPFAWYRGSLAEYIQEIIFNLFDYLENSNSDNFKQHLLDYFDSESWSEQ